MFKHLKNVLFLSFTKDLNEEKNATLEFVW